MKIFLYILYRYYSTGATKVVAYEQAIFVLLLLIFVNIISILIGSDLLSYLDFLGNNSRSIPYFILSLGYFIPGFILINFFVKKNDLKDYNLRSSLLCYEILMYCYIFLTFLFFVIAIINMNQHVINKDADLNF